MGIFDDIRTKGASYRLTEEALYAEALREIESGERRDGIWAKALAESNMDQGKAGARYIKLRVQSLKDEVTVLISDLKRLAAETQKSATTERIEGETRKHAVQQELLKQERNRPVKGFREWLNVIFGLWMIVAVGVSIAKLLGK